MRRTLQTLTWFFLRRPRSSGVIEVPENAVLPEEGLHVRIYVSNDVETYSAKCDYTLRYIISAISVHVEEGTGYRLFYVLDSNESFMEYGYYADSGVYTDKRWLRYSTYIIKTSAATS